MGIAHATHPCQLLCCKGVPLIHLHFQAEDRFFQFFQTAFRILHFRFLQRAGDMAEGVTARPEKVVAHPVGHAVKIGASPHAAEQVAEEHQFRCPVLRFIDGYEVIAQVAECKVFRRACHKSYVRLVVTHFQCRLDRNGFERADNQAQHLCFMGETLHFAYHTAYGVTFLYKFFRLVCYAVQAYGVYGIYIGCVP